MRKHLARRAIRPQMDQLQDSGTALTGLKVHTCCDSDGRSTANSPLTLPEQEPDYFWRSNPRSVRMALHGRHEPDFGALQREQEQEQEQERTAC